MVLYAYLPFEDPELKFIFKMLDFEMLHYKQMLHSKQLKEIKKNKTLCYPSYPSDNT